MTPTLLVMALLFAVPPQQPPTWKLSREMHIDGRAENLTEISAFCVFHDGTIVLGQAQDAQLKFYSPAGKSLGTFGRKGEGPGEFRLLGKVGLIGDTLWANDGSNHRTLLITKDHKLLRSFAWENSLKVNAADSIGISSVGGISPQVLLPGGELLHRFLPTRMRTPPTWFREDPQVHALVLTDKNGVFHRLVAWLPRPERPECTSPWSAGAMGGMVIVPYCATGLSDIAADGKQVAILLQENVPVASRAPSYHLILVGTRGDTLLDRKFPYTVAPVSRRDIDSVMDGRLKDAPPAVAEAMKKVTFPAAFAPVRRIKLGRDGTIWLSMFTRTPGEQWQVLDSKGALVGRVYLPAGTSLREASRSSIWAVEEDEDGLQSVVRYKVGS